MDATTAATVAPHTLTDADIEQVLLMHSMLSFGPLAFEKGTSQKWRAFIFGHTHSTIRT